VVLLLGVAAALVVTASGTDDREFDYDHPFHSRADRPDAGTFTEAGSHGAPGFDDPSVREFLPFIVQDVEGFWVDQFQQEGVPYEYVRVVIFRRAARGACRTASRTTGPFYCPRDRRLYLELGFFDALAEEYRARGDLALAYVVAHEIGHHVQALRGITAQVDRAKRQRGAGPEELSTRLELQADCFAGAWAYTTYERGMLERGDMAEALRAAAAVSETGTYGSVAQRRAWFTRGFKSGDPADCDTFS